MGTYRLSGRSRRLFKMSPIHHHFELIGWPETTVIIRFWVISRHLRGRRAGPLLRRLADRRRACADGRTRRSSTAWPSPARRRPGRWWRRGWDGGRRRRPPGARCRRAGRRARGRPATSRPTPPSWSGSWPASTWWCPAPACPSTTPSSPRRAPRGCRCAREIDLAYEWEQDRPGGPRPMLARHRHRRQDHDHAAGRGHGRGLGRRAVAAGNTDVPLVSALDLDVDVFVVECTSFRLAFVDCFRPRGRDVAEPRPRPPRLAPLAGHLRRGQGADLGAPAPRRRGHRVRRRPGRDGLAGQGARPPAHLRLRPGPTTTSTAAGWSGPRASSPRWPTSAGGCRTTSPTPWPPRPRCWRAGSRRPRASPRRWRRSRGSPTASRSWPKPAGCRSTTTRRRRRPTPP